MKKRPLLFLLFAGLLGGAGAGWCYRDRIMSAVNHLGVLPGKPVPQPQPERYAVLKQEAESWRAAHDAKYRACRTEAQREAVLGETRAYLETLLPEMMRCWTGTPWDFNGTAPGPGEGKIACGYFVATVLKDAGFRVDRYKLAQQDSQSILLTFLPKKELKIEAGTPYAKFAAALRTAEPGVRIIGLDHHVGFAVTTADGHFHFIHSSGLAPWCVVDEEEKDAESLRRSNYREQGLLTANREVLQQWLSGKPLAVKEPGQPAGKKPVTALISE
jgi:hypothetical protein